MGSTRSRKPTANELAAMLEAERNESFALRMALACELRGQSPSLDMSGHGVRVRGYLLGRSDGGFVVVEEDESSPRGSYALSFACEWRDRDEMCMGPDMCPRVLFLRDVVIPEIWRVSSAEMAR